MKLVTLIIATMSAFAQPPLWPGAWHSPRDRADLVQRLAVSELTVLGTVVKQDLAMDLALQAKRMAITTETPIATVQALSEEAQVGTGVLYTIRVDSVLCGANDFQEGIVRSAPKQLFIFRRLNDSEGALFDDPNPRADFKMNGKFLLILKADPVSVESIKKFGLDPNGSYYQVLNRARGAVQLDRSTYKEPEFFEMGALNSPVPGFTGARVPQPVDNNPLPPSAYDKETREAAALVEDATAICSALQSTDILQKTDALERLKSSPDLVMRKNAEIAIKILRGEPIL